MSASTQLRRETRTSASGRRELLYLREEMWTPIPSWARFFLELGESVGAYNADAVRTVAGVVLPIRSYAAALTAAGVVAARSPIPVNPVDPYEYFEWLASFPKGTAVCLRHGDRELNAVLLGCEETAYGPKVRVQVEKKIKGAGGGLTHWLSPEYCKRIRRVEKERTASTLPKAQRGRRVVAEKETLEQNRFAQAFLGEDVDVYDFVACSRLECLVAGPLGILREEIKETTFASRPSRTAAPIEGTLQEILRVRKFSGVNDDYRTNVVHGSGGGTAAEHAPVVIFDGAASFVRLRDDFRDSSWIVLVDRAERLADEAVDLLNSEYLQNRIEESSGPDVPDVPPGVEISVFEEAV